MFVEKLKSYHQRIYISLIFILSLGLSISLISVHEQFYQTEKDLCAYVAIFFAMLIFGLAGGIDFRKWYIWVEMLICAAATVLYVLVKNIRPSTYGESYFKVVAMRIVIVAVFAFLVVNLINRKTPVRLGKCVRTPFFWITLIACAVIAFFEKDWFPAVCPLVVFLLMDISNDRWQEICDCFSLSYGLGFAVFFARSLILAPTRLDDSGRYLGLFLNNSKLGALCGVAMLCFGYLFFRLMRAPRKNVVLIVAAVIMLIYATVAFLMVRGRTGELGLALAGMAAVAFLHGSTKKYATLKRIGIAVVVSVLVFAVVVSVAKVLQKKVAAGDMEYSDMSYSLSHIVEAVAEDHTRGGFEANTLLNALDILSAERLSTWKQLGVQIIPFGHVSDVDTATHSTFLYWLVKYGLYPGIAVILWFIVYGVYMAVFAVRGNRGVAFPLLWCAFYVGVFVTSNEYWGAPGGFMLLVFAYPLVAGFPQRVKNEK